MRLVRVKWGKLLIELPDELIIFLLLRTFLMLHHWSI